MKGADALLPELAADVLIADKAYNADERVIEPLKQAGRTAVIPPWAGRKHSRTFDRNFYQVRHLIERLNNKLKQFLAVAMRYEKTAESYLAAIQLAAAVIWLH